MKDERIEMFVSYISAFVMFVSGFLMSHYLFPRTVEVKGSETSTWHCPKTDGCTLEEANAGILNHEPTHISIMTEKKTCDAAGGEFYIFGSDWRYSFPLGTDEKYEISCTKSYTEGNKEIKETVFDYKI